MKTQREIAKELQHYLELYAISNKEEYLPSILIYAGMLAGSVHKWKG